MYIKPRLESAIEYLISSPNTCCDNLLGVTEKCERAFAIFIKLVSAFMLVEFMGYSFVVEHTVKEKKPSVIWCRET